MSKKDIMNGVESTSSKLIDNNTVRYTRPDGTEVIRLHRTDIVEFRTNGDIVLNSGGWRTATTKDRMNVHSEARIYTEKRVWYAIWQHKKYIFEDGMILHKNGTVTGAGELPDKALIKQIKAYAKGFSEALPVDQPSGGDCWGCLFESSRNPDPMNFPLGTDHLMEHMKEKYYVPSLLFRVLKHRGCGETAGVAWYWMGFKPPNGEQFPTSDWEKKQFARWIYDYLYVILIDKR